MLHSCITTNSKRDKIAQKGLLSYKKFSPSAKQTDKIEIRVDGNESREEIFSLEINRFDLRIIYNKNNNNNNNNNNNKRFLMALLCSRYTIIERPKRFLRKLCQFFRQ